MSNFKQVVDEEQHTHERAMSFISKLKDTLHEEQDVQKQIFQLLKDFGTGKMGHEEVAAKGKEFLKGHYDLLAEFNVFLPGVCKIDLNESDIFDNGEPVGIEEEAVNLIKMVKVRHQDKYEDFLMSLVMYMQGKKDIVEVYSEISGILSDSPDLLKIFDKFLEPTDFYKRYGVQVTPSYKLRLIELCQRANVLNSTCACVIKKDSREKPPLSPYEECVENVEDERFEADRERNILKSVIDMTKEWLKENCCNIIDQEKKFDLKNHFAPMYLTYMKKVCRDYSLKLDVENMSSKNARRILEKLEHKQAMLKQQHARLKQQWAKRLAKKHF